ncbi:MAG TPA: phenylacetate-CoA oxygenase/reductase subunit PaaK [Beijerinckiaceae bacterium]|nr:phenylacetate-CoA oxygenase/reductase subunit PaaK [Beijerinckiaceae bacterium]
MSRFNALTVSDIRRETPQAVSIAFRVPADLSGDYRFEHGQYLTLRRDIGGQDVRRSYSICTGTEDGELRIAVKEVEGGLFSTFVNRDLAVGDTLEVMTPMGRFTAPIEPEAAKTYVGIAAGSGITPLMSIIRTVLQREPKSQFVLLYGNRTANSVIFKTELEDLKDRFLSRLTVYHVLSREAQDVDLLHGRLEGTRISRLVRSALGDEAIDHAFICGPEAMTESARQALVNLGVQAERIHTELFTTTTPARPRPSVAPKAGDEIALTVTFDGATHALTIGPDETVIDAAARQGVDLPYSCKGGMCCTCRAKLTEGEVKMDHQFSLEPWELEAGYVLTCQSRPVKGPVALDYDHA